MLGILALAPMMPGMALRQSQQTIRLNVPFSAGTGPDLLARILGEELRQRRNKPVIVENKPGASGNIGTQAAARAAPDDLTLLVTVNTFVMNASLYRTIPYDPETSFVPIAEVATGVLALVVHPSINVNTFSELIAVARITPDASTPSGRQGQQRRFSDIGRAFGAHGEFISEPNELGSAIDCCLAAIDSGIAAALHVQITPL